MKRERYPSEEDVLDVCGSLVSGPLSESSIDKSESNRAVLARTTALPDFAPSSRVHSSDVSDAVPIVRDVPQEINAEAADVAHKPTQWMSILDGQLQGVAEISCLTELQCVSERMESEAGLDISSEILALLDDRSFCRLDELCRERLRSLCTEFHSQCLSALAQGTEWCPSKFVH
jgi:hypothetical protein